MRAISLYAFVLASTCVLGDAVVLNSGRIVTGSIIQQDDNAVVMRLDYGTFSYPKSIVKEIRREEIVNSPAKSEGLRIPAWSEVVSSLGRSSWATGLNQIPATVIEVGPLRDVPYISFQCGSGGYEVNIYGDLDHPAGVEIGLQKFRLNDNTARENCISFLSSILRDADDQATLHSLKREKDLIRKAGLTFEITPPDAADSYGGWWVSVYEDAAIEKARASAPDVLTTRS